MKNLINAIITASCLLIMASCNGGTKKMSVNGPWKGVLEVPGSVMLNAIFDFEEIGGKLTAKFYSIDQTEQSIAASEVIFNNKSGEIKVEFPVIGGVYQGKLSDSTIIGTFTQNNYTLNLDLKRISNDEFNNIFNKIEAESELYTSTRLTFNNKQGDISLAGTVTMPKDATNCPAVVLATGSGAQNRDSELMGHKPFQRIANYLSSKGIAVLRYDDRGTAASKGDFASSTTNDFLSDAIAGVEFMRSYENINPEQVGIIGHSEGGLIAFMAAADNKADFIVSLAGSTISGRDLLLLQAEKIGRASNVNEDTLRMQLNLNAAIFEIARKEPDDKKAKLDIIATIKHYAFNSEMKKDANAEVMANTVLTPWFRNFLIADAANYLPQIKCPTLIMFGEKDLQVPAKENEEAYYTVMTDSSLNNISLIRIEGVNHLFQKAETGLPKEYSNLDNPAMNDDTLDEIYNWMKDTVL